MVRTINIKDKPSEGPAGQKTFGKTNAAPAASEPLPEPKVAKQNFIMRFLDIMLYDILHKLRIRKEVHEEAMTWEDYQNFCNLARGKR